MVRPLLHFLWIGLALFAASRLLQPAAPPTPIVIPASRVDELRAAFFARAGRPPDAAELEGLVRAEADDELLHREAIRRGFDRDDPVVQRRLVQNLRFAGADPARDAASLYSEALDLGLDRSDPVVRRRLIQRMRLVIESSVPEPGPDDPELRAWYEANRARYREAARVRLDQVFFDGDPPGEARAALSRLRESGAGPAAARALGESFLYGFEQPSQSERELGERFGPDFAREVFALPVGVWSGPVRSSYGEHLVWIRERSPEVVRPFAAVRDEVRRAVLAERRRQALSGALAELRAGVPVVVSAPADPRSDGSRP